MRFDRRFEAWRLWGQPLLLLQKPLLMMTWPLRSVPSLPGIYRAAPYLPAVAVEDSQPDMERSSRKDFQSNAGNLGLSASSVFARPSRGAWSTALRSYLL